MDEKPSILWRILSPWTILAVLISVDYTWWAPLDFALIPITWIVVISFGIRPLQSHSWKKLVFAVFLRLSFATSAFWLVSTAWLVRDPGDRQITYTIGLFFLGIGVLLWLIQRHWRSLP